MELKPQTAKYSNILHPETYIPGVNPCTVGPHTPRSILCFPYHSSHAVLSWRLYTCTWRTLELISFPLHNPIVEPDSKPTCAGSLTPLALGTLNPKLNRVPQSMLCMLGIPSALLSPTFARFGLQEIRVQGLGLEILVTWDCTIVVAPHFGIPMLREMYMPQYHRSNPRSSALHPEPHTCSSKHAVESQEHGRFRRDS